MSKNEDAEASPKEEDTPEAEMKEDTPEAEMKEAEDSKEETKEVDSNEEKKEEDSKEEKKEEDSEESEEEKKKKQEELRKKYANWPLRNIKDPHDNDVMYGRGGGTNHHLGNKTYRKMVEDRKLEYVNSKRLDKPLVALEIIRFWRSQVPPGRFLKLNEKTSLWNDVGDKKAREKTSQALREKAPLIRKQQEDERVEDDVEQEEKEGEKTTRFAEGTKKESVQAKKPVLARDHSLGREYIEAGEAVSVEGFSWQDPFKTGEEKRDESYSRPAVATAYPAGRVSSHGSLGMAPPHHLTSVGGPPPPPDYWGRVDSSDDRQRQFSNGRIESWGAPYPYPPPPGIHASMHQRSGSWTHPPPPPPPPPPPRGPNRQRSGSWSSGREHSLSSYPLIGASVSGAANLETFDSGRSAGSSGYWGEGASPSRTIPPPPPPGPYGGVIRSGSLGPYRQPISPATSLSPPPNSTPSPQPYSVDMSVAKCWSGGEVTRTWSAEQPAQHSGYEYDGRPLPVPGADSSPMRTGDSGALPRPEMVKRDTSNQNENYETKPRVKRAALNRDNSLVSNRLKQEFMPEFYNTEMTQLSENFELSHLSPASAAKQLRPKPTSLVDGGRVSTIDAIAMDFMGKPAPMLVGNRVSTIDALDIDFDDDPIIRPGQSKDDCLEVLRQDLPKPLSLAADDRLTTKDFMDLVNSPIVEDDRATGDTTSEDEPLPLNQERNIAEEWMTRV